jgi:hypothetical protein
MVAPFQGGCACKAVRYEVASEPIAFALCHCRACQYASGGEPASVVVVPKEAFKLTRGSVKSYSTKADSGNSVVRQFCPECGTPLFSALEGNPGMWAIKAGSLDDPSWLKPTMMLWKSTAQPWAHMIPDIPAFDRQPA